MSKFGFCASHVSLMFENNVHVRSGKNYSRSVLKHFVPLSCKMYWPTECRCTRPTKCWSYKITAYKIDYPDFLSQNILDIPIPSFTNLISTWREIHCPLSQNTRIFLVLELSFNHGKNRFLRLSLCFLSISMCKPYINLVLWIKSISWVIKRI